MPSLYVVATPIGNLEDITVRALRVLREVPLIAAEDTRTTRKLLSRYDIHTPLTSFHKHNRARKLAVVMSALERGDVALVSEAGTPGISDPGLELVQAAVERDVMVVSIPGPSAPITALAASGLSAEGFLYLGFLPRKRGERQTLLTSAARLPHTLVLFEAPHRLLATLAHLLDVLGDRNTAVVREVTKLHEEVFRGAISQAMAHFQEPRGEFTLVIEGWAGDGGATPQEVEGMLRRLLVQGLPSRAAREQAAAETGASRREVYRAWLRLKGHMGG